MTDPYASEADTLALIRRDQRSDVEKKLEAMLDERGALEMGAEPFLILRQITLEQMTTIESIKQAITDPENQPSQFGTVTLAHMQREVTAEREACANAMAQIVMTPTLTHGALVKLSDVVNAIRARGQA